MEVESGVMERYSEGAKAPQAALCCAVDYDRDLLKLLPQEVIDKDYGCGDPSRYVQPGDTVLDLGSGSGKICYMAAQVVGSDGMVIGVDMNDDMLALARQYQPEMAEKLDGDRVRFVKGYIQDLALDLDAMENYLAQQPVCTATDLSALNAWQAEQRSKQPMIADNSVDLVVSNCVLNLVRDSDKAQLLREIFRVVKPGGRVAISDIVSDQPIPDHLKADPTLWSGCISGAMGEDDFIQAFADVGFHAVGYDKWEHEPWQVVEEIEFRSVTVTAHKPVGDQRVDRGHAVIYRGPFTVVSDEAGNIYPRGERIAVCQRTFDLLCDGPYRDDFIAIEPTELQPAKPWSTAPGTRRPVADTKRAGHSGAAVKKSCCG